MALQKRRPFKWRHAWDVILSKHCCKLNPEINDLNKYCYSCEKKCFSPATCRKCLTYKHNTGFSLHPHLLTNWIDPNNYCQSCRISASSRAFQTHSNRIHRVDSQGRMNPPIYELPYLKKIYFLLYILQHFLKKSKAIY